MLFGQFSNNKNHAAKRLIMVRAKLYDGSDVVVQVQDTELVFKTALGVSRILLSDIKHMKNIANVETLRMDSWANKFEIHQIDGSVIIGVPKSPGKIELDGLNPAHERGHIKLWEIDWLEVHSDSRHLQEWIV